MTDDAGTVLDHVMFDSFGNMQSQSSAADASRFGYTGQQQDAETGLEYDHARYYDPSTGRFLSTDPKGYAAGDDNLYRYVGNNPLTRTDPTGMEEEDRPATTPNATAAANGFTPTLGDRSAPGSQYYDYNGKGMMISAPRSVDDSYRSYSSVRDEAVQEYADRYGMSAPEAATNGDREAINSIYSKKVDWYNAQHGIEVLDDNSYQAKKQAEVSYWSNQQQQTEQLVAERDAGVQQMASEEAPAGDRSPAGDHGRQPPGG